MAAATRPISCASINTEQIWLLSDDDATIFSTSQTMATDEAFSPTSDVSDKLEDKLTTVLLQGTNADNAIDLDHAAPQITKKHKGYITLRATVVQRHLPSQVTDEDRRSVMDDENLKVLELAYRRVDIEDAVQACVCTIHKAKTLM